MPSTTTIEGFFPLKQLIHKKISSLFDYVSNPRLGFLGNSFPEIGYH